MQRLRLAVQYDPYMGR